MMQNIQSFKLRVSEPTNCVCLQEEGGCIIFRNGALHVSFARDIYGEDSVPRIGGFMRSSSAGCLLIA